MSLGRVPVESGGSVVRTFKPAGWLVAVTALVLMTGCVGGDSGVDETAPDGPQVGAMKDSAHSNEAPGRLADSIEAAMASGRYRQTVTVPGLAEPYYQVTGEYDVARKRYTAEMAFWNSAVGTTRTIKHTIVDSRGYQHAEGWHGPASGCWLVFDPASRSAVTPQTDRSSVKAPGAVLALDSATGLTTSTANSDVVEGTVELRAAVSLMLPSFIRQQGSLPDGTVPASFTLDSHGALSSWEVLGDDVARALSQAGTDAQSGFAAGLNTFTLEVSYDNLGTPVTVKTPPRSLWMSPNEMDAKRGCEGG